MLHTKMCLVLVVLAVVCTGSTVNADYLWVGSNSDDLVRPYKVGSGWTTTDLWIDNPGFITMGPDSNLYISSNVLSKVMKYDLGSAVSVTLAPYQYRVFNEGIRRSN